MSGGSGLSAEEVEASRAEHGGNRLTEISGVSFWALLRRSLGDRTLLILLAAAALMLGVDLFLGGSVVDGLGILVAVAVAALVTSVNEHRAQAAFKGLQLEQEGFQVRLRRAGAPVRISAFDVVVGDLVELQAGDKVPADGVVAEGGLLVDESLLTGEAVPVSREAGSGDAELRAGTLVVDGSGILRITAVGERTEYGRLRAHLAAPDAQTPLQQRLATLADRISGFGVAAAVAIFLALVFGAYLRGDLEAAGGARRLLDFIALAVTIVVVAVPEGLPVAVTLSLAYNVRKMLADRALVRRLMACETMGAAEVICLDKTGTLTLNKMQVELVLFADHEPEEVAAAATAPLWIRDLFAQIVSVNSTASLAPSGAYHGNPTEIALLELVESWEVRHATIRAQADVVTVRSFLSERRRMVTVVRRDARTLLYAKGAPEEILPRCTHRLHEDGPRPLVEGELAQLEERVERWGEAAVRTLAVAYRELPAGADPTDPALETRLVLVGLAGISDPIRPEASEAIRICREAGLEPKLVTGDARGTAVAVATRIGLLGPGDTVLEGAELRASSDEELSPLLERVRVVARANPTDKLRLVRLLQASGRVVAVTGDGTNDAPALRHADVGLSMGRSGTDVAREASDIVLLDDNFATVVKAVRWGRAIFGNVRRFLQFQLTVSLTALATSFVAALAGRELPVTVVQLLWINLIMDALAAVALGSEPPSDELLRQQPQGRREPLVSTGMWGHVAVTGLVAVIVLLGAIFTGLLAPEGDPTRATMIFNLFVCLQLGTLITCRCIGLEGDPLARLGSARTFLGIVGLIAGAQVAIVELGGPLLQTVPLPAWDWLYCVLLGSLPVGASRLARSVAGGPLAASGRLQLHGARLVSFGRAAAARLSDPGADRLRLLLAAAGGLAIVAGMVLRLAAPSQRGLALASFVLGVALVLPFLWFLRRLRVAPGPRAALFHTAASSLLALVLVAEVNFLASRHYRRIDLTAGQSHELSEQTRGLLASVGQPVRITTVFREGSLRNQVTELLAEYAAQSPLVELHAIDPDRDPGELERLASELGGAAPRLSAVAIQHQGRSRVITAPELQVVAYEYKKGRRIRRGDQPVRFRGEEAISSGIAALRDAERPVVCVATGHGERSSEDFGPEGLALARDMLRREGYEVRQLPLLGGSVARDCAVLLQAGPARALAQRETEAIEAYLETGGKWLLTVEPFENAGLATLLSRWGLGIRPMYLVDPSGSSAGLGATSVLAWRFQEHPISSPLQGSPVLFPYATSVHSIATDRQLIATNLVLTDSKAFGETSRDRREPHFDAGVDRRGGLSIAAAVEEPADLYAADGRKNPARIVVVGDTDFATNRHVGEGGGKDLLLNAVDWLARREELISVRAREPQLRRLTLTKDAQGAIYWASLGLLPALAGLVGGAVAYRRRR